MMSRNTNGLFSFTFQATENMIGDLGVVMFSVALKTNTALVILAL